MKIDRKAETDHIGFLDGVRGFAALWVLLGHAANAAQVSIRVISENALAVDVFMVLSGFLMTQHYFLREHRERWESPRTWVAFYVRRFFRIAPLYYLVLIPSFIWLGWLHEKEQWTLASFFHFPDLHMASSASLANVVMHASFLFGLFPKYCSALTIPDWSIGLEMQFYALFPFLMLAARRFKIGPFSLGILALWIAAPHFVMTVNSNPPPRHAIIGPFLEPSFFPLKAGVFLIGILLAWAFMEERHLSPRAAVLTIFAVATGYICHPIVGAFVLITAMVLFGAKNDPELGIRRPLSLIESSLSNRFARFLGDVSYSVYLIHKLVIVAAEGLLRNLPQFVHRSGHMRFALLALIAIGITYPVSWLTYELVERPGIALGKRAINRLGSIRRETVQER